MKTLRNKVSNLKSLFYYKIQKQCLYLCRRQTIQNMNFKASLLFGYLTLNITWGLLKK